MDAERAAAIDWHRLDGNWYCAATLDVGMYPTNVVVIGDVLARGGRIRTVVDIGAHVGFTAVPCARLGAAVWAYEANPWTFGCLALGVMRNGLEGLVRPLHAAVRGAGGGLARVRSKTLVSGMAGLVQAEDQPVVGYAAAVGIEDVLAAAGRIDFLKLDVEGGEHDILPAVSPAAWKAVDWFHLETHDVTQAEWHAPGARNIDWEKLVRGVGFERITPALWRMKSPAWFAPAGATP